MVNKIIGHTYNFFSCLFHRIKGKKRTIFIGPHTRIKNPSKICLSSDVILGRYGYLSVHSKNGNISIGERTNIGMFFQIACLSSVKIGKDCLFAANCYIADFTHEYKDINNPISKQKIYVKHKAGGVE